MSSVISSNSAPQADVATKGVLASSSENDVVMGADDQTNQPVSGDQEADGLSQTQYVFPLPPSSPPSSPGFNDLSHVPQPLPPSLASTTLSVYHTPAALPPCPPTPPPFSDLFTPPARTDASKGMLSGSGSTTSLACDTPPDGGRTSVEFHTRQKRAAKLSKFFGVEMNTLAEVLPTSPRTSTPADSMGSPRSGPRPRKDLRVITNSDGSTTMINSIDLYPAPGSPRVEVSREFGRGRAKEVDMYDAIDKLRRMKST